jgi:hypothetical protein
LLATARIPVTAMTQARAMMPATNTSKEDRNNMTSHKIRNTSNIRDWTGSRNSKLEHWQQSGGRWSLDSHREKRNTTDVNSRRETHNSTGMPATVGTLTTGHKITCRDAFNIRDARNIMDVTTPYEFSQKIREKTCQCAKSS